MTHEPPFSGVWCPSITPMDSEGRVDLNGLSKHIARLSAAKIDVILLMGSIGEFASLLDGRAAIIDPQSAGNVSRHDGCQRLVDLLQRYSEYGR